MSLDERVRVGLRRSAGGSPLEEDGVFDDVRSTHSRGLVRARVMRQATAVMVVVTLFVGVALFLSWKTTPYRYRSVATVSITGPTSSSTGGLRVKLADPLTLALAPGTRRAALLASRVPEGTRIEFRASRLDPSTLSLTATASHLSDATSIPRHWTAVLARKRQGDAKQRIKEAIDALTRRVEALHRELRAVDAKLVKIDPVIYGGVLRFDGPHGNFPGRAQAPPPVPEQGSVRERNLAFERIQILKQLIHAGEGATSLRIAADNAPVSTKLVSQTPAGRVDGTPPATVPALVAWCIAVALVLIGALTLYRRNQRIA